MTLTLKIVDRHPDLERLVRLSASSTTDSVDTEEFRRQIQSAFNNVGGRHGRNPYYALREVVEDLDPFFTKAEDYAENNRLGDTAPVYRLLLEETRNHYQNFHDEEVEVGSVISESCRHLGEILDTVDDEDLRDPILRTLFDTYLWDLDLGGYGLGDWAYRTLVENATSDERHRVADWVRDEFDKAGLL